MSGWAAIVRPPLHSPPLMARHYELVLMLDPEVDEGARDKIVADVRSQIESAGTLDHADSWGTRKMAYEIRRRNEADYRFFRFQGENALLESLDHNLKIVDGALRFRIFKVDPEAPTAPPPSAGERPPREDERPPRRGSTSAPAERPPAPATPTAPAPTPPAPEAPGATEAPAPTEAPTATEPPSAPPATPPAA